MLTYNEYKTLIVAIMAAILQGRHGDDLDGAVKQAKALFEVAEHRIKQ